MVYPLGKVVHKIKRAHTEPIVKGIKEELTFSKLQYSKISIVCQEGMKYHTSRITAYNIKKHTSVSSKYSGKGRI